MATTSPLFADASLEDLLARARQRFSIVFKPVRIGEHTLEITHIENMTDYLDRLANQSRQGETIELPLWAKIWPASTILALSMTQIPATASKRILEIGAGLGIPGLVAAARGFTTVITDTNEDALLFTRINVLKNGLEKNATVQHLDILTQDTDQPFDAILGSEVFYLKDSAPQIVRFLRNSLVPGGMALFARDAARQNTRFLTQAAPFFEIGIKQVGYKQGEEEHPFKATLYRLTPKNEVNAQ
ncbi:class I SAM-dependent methyltransferase [Desulfoplanes formicivorans]|uniref:Methyltransferase n=1 Tax=Desulfoplanes formicivorans TaxID=1592317 RepID=A0A194ADL3_9BACT|nr:methyltransferase [Desulfoplanes formicivorans]GAU07433.1 methyltransferase [Desulfoplanes formicivorans]